MKMIHYLLGAVLLSVVFTGNIKAQVSNENEDGVYKIDSRHANDYVSGQVLFKLKDGQRATVRRAAGHVQSAGISSLDAVLKEFEVHDMEQLLPNAKVSGTPRRAKAFNGDIIVERDLTQLYRVVLPEEKADKTFEMIEQLKKLDEVEFAEPNYKVYIMADDNIAADYSGNPMVNEQWYLDAYGVKELWNKPIINKTRPVIAIIDTGVDITHPDLKDNIWTKEGTTDEHGYDFINNTTKMRDNNKHGTHVAGIAAAANNGVGIIGANPRALIMPITVMQSDGTGDVATIVKGIDYAVKNGATVLNLSLGTYAYSQVLRQSLEKAYHSAVIVAAAGNDGRCVYESHYPIIHKYVASKPCFPAAYSFVLGIQASSFGGGLANFSNYDDDGPLFSCESTLQDPDGFNYELIAPGANILSTIPGGSYKILNGTSMASPLVAGSISALQMVKQYDTQEMLWGDLLHSTNIADAYSLSSQPAELEIVRVLLRDHLEDANETEEDYSGDNEVDAGETIYIYPVVRTTFGEASNIKLKLVAGDLQSQSLFQTIIDEVSFGTHLDAFGKGISKSPLVLRISDNINDGSIVNLKIIASCDESSNLSEQDINFAVNNMIKLSGLLTQDKTLSASHAYYVNESLGIADGTTLTIEPGTRIEFAEDTEIRSFGKLKANGTPQNPIVFTTHGDAKRWNGITSVRETYHNTIFMDKDTTLFTLLQTTDTPYELTLSEGFSKTVYTKDYSYKRFSLTDYLTDWVSDFTGRESLLKDLNFLTPSMLAMLKDWKDYLANCQLEPTEEANIKSIVKAEIMNYWTYTNPIDTISYCRVDNYYTMGVYAMDCIFKPHESANPFGTRNVLTGIDLNYRKGSKIGASNNGLSFSNIVNNNVYSIDDLPKYSDLLDNNYFNNFAKYIDQSHGKYDNKLYSLTISSNMGDIDVASNPSYLGTSREDIIRQYIYESGNGNNTTGTIDLSNMRTEPVKEAHGIVWKVLVNGKDAQDEQEELLPLGVGKHKFEVYFNRPMNKNVEPQVSFGVRAPYNQHPVAEEENWNEEGTIYTAYVTIDGKTKSDGLNRICVHDAEDNEYFPCPYEATRFNILVQAAGSMASGFQADAGLGCVNLTWNNENNDFEDAMGFHVYRYTQGNNGVNDTIRINENILDISATSYTDDNVTPGQTYYYYYKVLSTALQEYDVSNVVVATPLTATRGDANGSGTVDVADVVTTVNYVTGLQPKPFVFDAADMNADKLIDIFDVVSIIRGILDPNLLSTASLNDEPAVYSIEDGVLYVESTVALGGLQVQLTLDRRGQMEDVRVAEDLDGFETASAWLSDNDYLFLAYSLNGKTLAPGKHALLYIGDAEISSLRLSDTTGKNVNVSNGDGTTVIDRMGKHVMNINGIYDLQGRKLSSTTPLQNGIYIINGKKVVK